jgi:hypothetical protein
VKNFISFNFRLILLARLNQGRRGVQEIEQAGTRNACKIKVAKSHRKRPY